ncbi:MAG: hypothetical protein IPG90_02890 [Bacteroidetes bacterium]|nr:hypothetical protein [Bacteroidota bacterium]
MVKPLKVSHGLPSAYADENDGAGTLADQFDSTLRVEEFISTFYKNQFFSVEGDEPADDFLHSAKLNVPKELEEIFSKQVLSKIQGTYLWIKLQFTTAFPLNSISDLYVSINCFPVINRHLNKFTYRLQNTLNIVPLATDDLFQDLINISTSEGKSFMSNPLGTGFQNEAGFYTLRYGGVERFDDRQSVEMLNNILELLRDESAAFSSLGNDFISSYIRQINQSIAMIENRLDMKGQKAKPGHFLLVNPYTPDENIFVMFWSTNGGIANQIKAGTKLTSYSGAEMRSDSLLMMTTTTGGKDSLNENERITAYKKALLTHDRVITEQDIRNFCFHELGSLIRKVDVRKNWEVVNQRTHGIRRVLEVVLTPARNHSLNQGEWNNLAKEVKVKLELQSTSFLPVKVLVENN